jgi:hypothetical protein
MSLFAVVFEGYDDTASTPVVDTYYFATADYMTRPDDTPSNMFFPGRVKNAGNYQRALFSDGTTVGNASVGAGEVVLTGIDGELDFLKNIGMDGRPLWIYKLEDLDTPFSDAILLFKGTISQAVFSWNEVILRMRDRMEELRRPLQTTLYAGTTTSAGATAEGRPDDIKGQPKPLLYGTCYNIPVIPANIFDKIFQVSDGAINSVFGVFDKGAALTLDTSIGTSGDFASLALLQAATVAASKYATCLAGGYIKLGSIPAGQITVDASEGANSAARSMAQITKRILIKHGLSGADYDDSSFDDLDALNDAECGIWVSDNTATIDVAHAVLSGGGAWLIPNRLGVFQVGRIEEPAIPSFGGGGGSPMGLLLAITGGGGTPYIPPVFTNDEILDNNSVGIDLLPVADQGRGIPSYRVNLNYKPSFLVQSGDATVNTATQARRDFVAKPWRTAIAEDSSVLTKHLLSPELFFDSYFILESDALTEVARRLDLYKTRKDRFKITLREEFANNIDLSDVIEVDLARFGLSGGKLFLVVGIREDFGLGRVELDIWG